jgi:hypothetical protein
LSKRKDYSSSKNKEDEVELSKATEGAKDIGENYITIAYECYLKSLNDKKK